MSLRGWLRSPRTRLDVVAGVVDGMLTALALSAGRLLQPGSVSLELAIKVGAASSLTNFFVFLVAHYAELRAELVQAERQLNLLTHGRLASSQLGRQVFRESLAGALVAAVGSFVGAGCPLLLSVVTPGPVWAGLALTIVILGLLGALLATTLYGSRLRWALGVMSGGVALTVIGMNLRIIG